MNNKKQELYGIVKYFDDYFESIHSENLSEEQVKEAIKNLEGSIYTTYRVKTMEEINKYFRNKF